MIKLSGFMRNLIIETKYFEILNKVFERAFVVNPIANQVYCLVLEIFALLTVNKGKSEDLKRSGNIN